MTPLERQVLGKNAILWYIEEDVSVKILQIRNAIEAKGYSGGIHGATVGSGRT
jgi:hypothetical protein